MDFTNFSGLLQTTTSSFLRRPDQLTLAINVHGDNVGSITKRLGYSQYGDAVSAGNNVMGLHSYNNVGTGNQYLFAVANGNIKYNNSGTWTSVQSGLTATAKVEFRVFLDQLFLCGSAGSTFLTSANIAGTTYSTATNLTSAPDAKYVEVYKDRLYFANLDGFPDRFQYSSVPDTAATAITWPATNFERVYTNNGEEIMGLHTNLIMNELLIFKRNSVHAWDTFRLRDVGNVGTTSHRSIKTINFTTFFFEGDGIYALNGSQPQLISRPIEKWIQGISKTNHTAVFAETEGKKYYKLFVGNVTVDGKVYSNCEYRYSIVDNTWTIYSYFDSLTIYAKHTVSSEERVYSGDGDGEVMQFAHEDDEVYSDDGNPIPAQFMFESNLGIPSERKKIDRALIYCSRPQNLTGRIRVKGRDWDSNFSVDEDEQEIRINSQSGRILEWHFSETGKVAPFIWEGLNFIPHLTSKKY